MCTINRKNEDRRADGGSHVPTSAAEDAAVRNEVRGSDVGVVWEGDQIWVSQLEIRAGGVSQFFSFVVISRAVCHKNSKARASAGKCEEERFKEHNFEEKGSTLRRISRLLGAREKSSSTRES